MTRATALALVATLASAAARAQDLAPPPAPAPPPRGPGDLETEANFQRQHLTPETSPTLGLGGEWRATVYGVAALTLLRDSTSSFRRAAANNRSLLRPGSTGDADQPQVVASSHDSRVGFKIGDPGASRIRWLFLGELGFVQTQGPGVFVRHLFASVETPILDVLVGRYYDLFGWQGRGFFANTVATLGVPGEPYRDRGQVRLGHVFRFRPVDLEIAGAVVAPAEARTDVGELQLGLRLAVNGWVGATSQGAGPATTQPLQVGLSAIGRTFEVASTAATAADLTGEGGGLALDLFVPLIPTHGDDLTNALSMTAELTTGTGLADLYPGLTGNAIFPVPPNPTNTLPPPIYDTMLPAGVYTFDADQRFRTITWRSAVLGVRYQLPFARGHRAWLSTTGSSTTSSNLVALSPPAGRPGVWDHGLYWDANAFVAIWRGLQGALSYQVTRQRFGDGVTAQNRRAELALSYYF